MKKIIVILSLIFIASFAIAQNTPHPMYAGVLFEDMLTFPAVGEVTFTAENLSTGEILTDASAQCDYGVSAPGFIQLQMATYPTQWVDGDVIHIEAFAVGYFPGICDIAITAAAGFSYYPGVIILEEEGGPVPVTLSDFSTAVFVNEFVEISWTTQSCTGMSMWNLYRQDPSTTEQFVIHTTEAINSTEPQEYNFEDIYVEIDQTYDYYLEAVDYDGSSIMYGPVSATMLGEDIPELPNQTELFGNHPNPFNPATFINFNVKDGETATLSIFNTKGQVVMNRTFNAGFYNYNWQADSNPSGVYFYKLQSDSHTSVKKMLLLK